MCGVYKPPIVSGLRPLTPEETQVMEEFKKLMEETVIPEIVTRDFENRELVAESRKWILN